MLDELQHLLLVVETGTFTEAARRAHLTQPALSASIRRLEERVGARLLERLPRGARLTAAGEAWVPHARAAIGAWEAGRRAVAEIEGLAAGRVTVGGGATACTYLLPGILTEFRAKHPGVTLGVREVLTPLVGEAVRAGALDLGVAQGEGEPWLEDELILVGAPGATLPAPFVTFVRGSSVRAALEATFPEAEIAVELGSIASVKGMARAGMGVALLSRAACQDDLAHGTLVEIPEARLPLRRSLGLLHAGLERLSPAGLAMRELMLQAAHRLARTSARASV